MFRLMRAIFRLTNTVQVRRRKYNCQLTVVRSSSYLYRICKSEDGSHEPKHVAPCSPLFFNK